MVPCDAYIIKIDEYVPIRFRSYSTALGVKYIKIGTNRMILELLLDPISYAIRGFTLVLFNSTHQPRILQEMVVEEGFPILAFQPDECFHGPLGAQRQEIIQAFSVGFGTDFVEIDLGNLVNANRLIKCRGVEFCLEDETLAGIRVVGLTPDQIATMRSCQAPLDRKDRS